MAVSAFGVLSMLLFSGGFSLPLGLPPLPEDPVISRVAPKECLAYISWAGTAKPDAKSANQTEQLLAEPEVQRLFSAIDSAVTMGIKRASEHDSSRGNALKAAFPLGKTLLMRPAAVFLSQVGIGATGPTVQGGAIFNLGDSAASAGESLRRLEKLLPPGMAERVEVAGDSYHSIKASPTMALTWGVRKNYLIVGVGEGSLEGILKRLDEQPPEWLATIRKQLTVDRQSTLVYFNINQAVSQFAPLGGPKMKLILNAVGLNNVRYLAAVTGLDGTGTVSRTLLAIDGEPEGLLRLAAAKPLAASDLGSIPRDATIAAVGRCDAGAVLKVMLEQIEKVDPSAPKEVTRGIAEMEKALGIDLREDVLDPLGDVWCVYDSPGEGGLLVTGLTGTVQVKDHNRLEATLNNLISLVHDRTDKITRDFGTANGARVPRIVKTDFCGKSIYHVEIPEHDFFLAPAWCLTEKELIVSTFPQNIKTYLSRGKEFQSLAAAPEVARALAQGDATALSYGDMRKLAEFVYPLACIGGKVICSELNREGIPLDASLLPSAAAIFPHLQPSVGVVRHSPIGIELESRGPLAGMGGGPLLPTSLLWLGVARSSAQQNLAREQAIRADTMMAVQRSGAMNNLKMIALAALNYEAVYRTYPPAYIADKATGKPLLSWRVAILPYIDQAGLYQQFHLDEPWDSENNKKLVARMPPVYRSAGPATAMGRTRYVALRHKDSVFPGKDGIRISDVPDGTSNTIMVVEADQAHAVTWTAPEDLQFDPDKPGIGLTGQPAGGFYCVFCDGAARFLRNSIDSEALRNLVNRHDGHVVTLP